MNDQDIDQLMQRASATLRDIFGYDAFRTGQEAIIRDIFSGRQVLAVMATGAGKSLCFQIPALVQGGLTVVVSPLVSLMEDQVAALKLAGVGAETINSSRDRSDNLTAWHEVQKGNTRLLYISPERLMTDRMLQSLHKLPLTRFVIDEAHCVSAWGHSFREDYIALKKLNEIFPGIPVLAFTATADDLTRNEIMQDLFKGQGKIHVGDLNRDNIKLTVQARSDWKGQLLHFLDGHPGASGIVYCRTRKATEETASYLQNRGFQAYAYHAGLDDDYRQKVQDTFMTDRGVVVAATIAFGMGIDKADVRFVFHRSMPGKVEAYYQEIGRAGRDGLPSEAFLLFSGEDIARQYGMIETEFHSSEQKMRAYKRLDTMISYSETGACRWQPLLAYFGQEVPACGDCDNCLEPPVTEDRTEDGLKVLKTIVGTGQRFGGVHLINILRGSQNQNVLKWHHHELPEFGTGRDLETKAWKSIIRQLGSAGFLKTDIAGYGSLMLTTKGKGLLRGEHSFLAKKDKFKVAPRSRPPQASVSSPDTSADATQEWAPAISGMFDETCFDALKSLRLEIAREQKVAAYVIFTDKSLKDMATRKPQNKEQFKDIYGVGKSRLDSFADMFLELIAEHVDPEQNHEFVFQKKPAAPKKPPAKKKSKYQNDYQGFVDKDCFNALKRLRLNLARNEGVAAFIIFTNKQLTALAQHKPQTQEDFLAVKGMGPKKYKKYGTLFMEEIAKYLYGSEAPSPQQTNTHFQASTSKPSAPRSAPKKNYDVSNVAKLFNLDEDKVREKMGEPSGRRH